MVAAVVLLLCASAVAFAVLNFADLAEYSRESADDASRPRYQALRGLGLLPAGIIVLGGGFAIAASIALFGSATHEWIRTETGTRLRKRFEGYHAVQSAEFERLHSAFAAGDPSQYLPLPPQTRGGTGVVLIWTADADRIAFVGLTWGNTRRSTRNAPLIRLDGERFDALDRALRAGLTEPWTGAAATPPPGTTEPSQGVAIRVVEREQLSAADRVLADHGTALFHSLAAKSGTPFDDPLTIVPFDGGVAVVRAIRGGGTIFVAADRTVMYRASSYTFDRALAEFRAGERTPLDAFR